MRKSHEVKNKKQKDFYNKSNPEYLIYQKNIPYARYIVAKMLPSLAGRAGNILEIGAGQGRFTLELARHVGKIFATDISQKEISLLEAVRKKLRIHNIETYVYDVFAPDATLKEKFDQVVGFFILHHLDRHSFPLMLRNIMAIVKKHGRLSFIEPNNLYPFHLVQIMMESQMKWEIEKGIYTNYLGCFKKACRKEGLKLVNFRKFGFIPPPLINKWPFLTAVDVLIEKIPLLNQIFCPYVLIAAKL